MSYVAPANVTSPQERLNRSRILYDGGADGWAAALVTWDGVEGCLALRWNGSAREPKGTPISTGHPVWFICPDDLKPVLLPLIQDIAATRRHDAGTVRTPDIDLDARIRRAQAWARTMMAGQEGAGVDDFLAFRRAEAANE